MGRDLPIERLGQGVPEGHTIHREARDQTPMLRRKLVAVSSPQGRFFEGAALIDGRRCMAVEAYGKHLFYRFAGGDTLHVHLGLYGKFRKAKLPAPEPKGAVRIRMETATHVVDCNGPTACEVLDLAAVAKLMARLGPDVLRDDADPEAAWSRIARSRAPIGQLVMDQAVIAGLGNIYRTEILWRQRIHPRTEGRDLTRGAFDAFWADSAALLRIGVAQKAIITVDGAMRGKTRYGARTNIFKKQVCPRCDGPVRQFAMTARKVFCCETCQVRVVHGDVDTKEAVRDTPAARGAGPRRAPRLPATP